ncbi:hypothetical protein JOD31_003161 [Methylopila capsulata]|uniref:Uncharacterized protein n=1 Tax=Methylopila capsulata TaxID=61654 RepID=A0A9W6MSU8_9HYPH|nr:hypothetical protein [Methylopila capsulata]MBM7852919.1 hypothetical protein [Methylopila capsulata]GLK57130.1 hypothetical protein GCM10008170_31490 [Methylopila capsulata]
MTDQADPNRTSRTSDAERREAERRERLAAALRENLKRRKAHARARRAPESPDGEGR